MSQECFVCHGSALRPVRRYRANTKYGRILFGAGRIYEWAECGGIQVLPLPDGQRQEDYYEKDYRRLERYGCDVADPASFPKDNLFYLNRGRSAADLLSQYLNMASPAVLDIGAGSCPGLSDAWWSAVCGSAKHSSWVAAQVFRPCMGTPLRRAPH